MIKTFEKALTKTEEVIVAFALLYSVLMITLSVLLRALGHGIQWSDESVRYFMIMAAFIGCSLCVKRGAHISIDILEILVKKKPYRYIKVLINIISLAFSVFMTVLGAMMIQKAYLHPQLSPALQIPMWVCYLTIPIGFALTSLRYFGETVRSIKDIATGVVDDGEQGRNVEHFNV